MKNVPWDDVISNHYACNKGPTVRNCLCTATHFVIIVDIYKLLLLYLITHPGGEKAKQCRFVNFGLRIMARRLAVAAPRECPTNTRR